MNSETRKSFAPFEGALLFDDWSNFIVLCNQIKQPISNQQACELVGIRYSLFERVIDEAFANWRESTSQSILHGISHLQLGNVPPKGTAVFVDLMWQTRFFLKCKPLFPVFAVTYQIKKDDVVVKVKNESALGATESAIRPANNILRCLYLYWWLNSIKQKKLPKRIYRGIRAHDLYNSDTLKPLIAAIFNADKSREMKRKDAIDFLIKWICDRKLHQITDGNLLSFTASIPVAKYFSNGNGFILSVDPSKVEIISSELHDERLHGKDYMSNLIEREYIIRIPRDYDFQPSDIIINDKDYFVAEMNPMVVGLFDHDDIEARYTLHDMPIRAWYRWSSNNSGGLVFNSVSRREFIKSFGFDPMPSKDNLNKISDFKIIERKKW